MVKKNKRAKTQAPAKADRPPLWNHRLFPPVFFLALSLLYFYEFPLSDKIVFGMDVGTDYHKGADLSFWDKVQTVDQPMWDPKMGGFPQSEAIRPQYFPAYVLYFFTSFQRYIGWRYILTMFAAGLGMYAYLRQIHVGGRAALWGGVAFMSAPTFLAFPLAGHYAKMGVIALFPWIIWALEKALAQRRLIYWAAVGVLIGACIYSHPPMTYFALLGLGVYFLFKLYQMRRDQGLVRRSIHFIGAVVLGLALGAEGAFPVMMYTRAESKRAVGDEVGGKTAEEQLAYARSWSLHPEEVASLVVPEFGGYDNVLVQGGSRYWGRNAFKINSEYFGALAVLLALLMVPECRRRPQVVLLGGVFVLALAYVLGEHTPVHWLAFHLLPGADVQRAIGMGSFVFAFAGCAMAGLGLQRVLDADADERALLRGRLVYAGGILAAFALLVALFPKGATDAWISALYEDIAPQKRAVLAGSYDWIARGGWSVVLALGAGLALLYLRLWGQLSATVLVAGLCAVTVFDTWRVDRVYLHYRDPGHYTDIRRENPRAVQFLQKDESLFRVLPLPSFRVLEEPGYHLHGVWSITGFHDLTVGRYDRMLKEFEPRVQQFLRSGVPSAGFQSLLNLLNGKYLAVPKPLELNMGAYPLRFEGARFRLYENPQALPWFYLVPEAEVLDSGEAVLARLLSGRVDPQGVALLEKEPAVRLDGAGDRAGDRVERLAYDPKEGLIRLRTESAGARVLVVSENYQSNWSVWVDGEEAEMVRVYYVWKGVALPAGEHEVELRYFSPVLAWARGVGLVGLIVVVVVVVGAWRQRRRDS